MEGLSIEELRIKQESIIDEIETNQYIIKEIEDSIKIFSNSQKDKERIAITIQRYMDEITYLTMKNTEISYKLNNYHIYKYNNKNDNLIFKLFL